MQILLFYLKLKNSAFLNFFNKNWKYLKIYTKETKKKVKLTAFVIKIISDLMFYLLNITIHEKGTLKPNTLYF